MLLKVTMLADAGAYTFPDPLAQRASYTGADTIADACADEHPNAEPDAATDACTLLPARLEVGLCRSVLPLPTPHPATD